MTVRLVDGHLPEAGGEVDGREDHGVGTDRGNRQQSHQVSDIGPSASQILLSPTASQTHSMGQSDVARSHELQVKKCKAQLVQMDERYPYIMGSLIMHSV